MRANVISMVVVLIALVLTSTSHADQLLVLIEGPSDSSLLNRAFDHWTEKSISKNFAGSYRHIYSMRYSAGANALSLFQQAVFERQINERLDVIEITHGPNRSIIPDVAPWDAQKLLGYGYVRRVFSTGCSMWGLINFHDEIAESSVRFGFPAHIANLGADEYILFANMENIVLPYASQMLDAMKARTTWSAGLVSLFKSIDAHEALSLEAFTQSMKDGSRLSTLYDKYAFISPFGRPVFGTKISQLNLADHSLVEATVPFKNQLGDSYREQMIAFSPKLADAIREFCPSYVHRFKPEKLNGHLFKYCQP